MGQLDEQAALVALLRDQKSGWGAIADDVESRGSALKVLASKKAGSVQGALFPTDAGQDDEARLAAAREAILAWRSQGMHLVTLTDADYPAQLLTIHQRPPFLFYRGRLDSADVSGVAVVGTRKATLRGLSQAQAIAGGLARRGVTVISGLAAGIDAAAHNAALDAHGRTVAVVGTGLLRS